MGRAPCCEKVGLKRGPWTPEEDQKLIAYINENGHGSWRALPKKAGLLRCGKSCRLRWTNYLRPDIKRGEFSLSEEQSIIQLHALLGNRWSAIASHLPKRTDNEIKNYWNTHLKKKLLKMGLDPITHKPKVDNTLMSSNADPKSNADADNKDKHIKDTIGNSISPARQSLMANSSSTGNGSSITNHMAQWESARLEAEARLMQEAQLRAKGMWSSHLAAQPVPRNVMPLAALSPWNSATSMRSPASSSIASADACKAMDLMHTLRNWEKSLQGQAVMMWPESRWLPSIHFAAQEVQAESSSCSSPCSDVNTNHNTSPSVTAGPNGMDHLSPTSTLCSLDSHNIKQKGLQSPFTSGMHMRKLSWSDTLAPPLIKPEMPLGFCMQPEVTCKAEEDSSTFSSLMQEAMINADAVASAFVCSQEESGGAMLKSSPDQDVIDEDDASCGMDLLTCEKPSLIVAVKDQDMAEEDKGASREKPSGTSEEQSIDGISHDADDMGVDGCTIERKGDENSCISLPSAVDLEEKETHEIKGCKDGRSENKCHDGQESNEAHSTCIGGSELMSAEMFKDLPKLKSEVSTTHITSFCTLLSDDISDYWSNIMLKEPSLQQGDMTF